ncbi:MAG TPA: nucleotidyltransferase substrate binding protein [Armatimonadota bacterium]|jgi:nucleotidyltransferase substrate binding protein (TIGR01987 family)
MNEMVLRDVRKLGIALDRLSAALSQPESSTRGAEDTALAFEYAMDLFWKVAKEMLATRGVEAHMPREAVHHAQLHGWIEDPEIWIEMLKDEYQISGGNVDPNTARRIHAHIKGYYPEMCRVHVLLQARADEA